MPVEPSPEQPPSAHPRIDPGVWADHVEQHRRRHGSDAEIPEPSADQFLLLAARSQPAPALRPYGFGPPRLRK